MYNANQVLGTRHVRAFGRRSTVGRFLAGSAPGAGELAHKHVEWKDGLYEREFSVFQAICVPAAALPYRSRRPVFLLPFSVAPLTYAGR